MHSMTAQDAISLSTLGSVDIAATPEAGDLLMAQPKRLALLIYLAHARPRGLRRRDELVARFWPEVTDEAARNALSQALHFLRRTLGEHVLVSRGIHEVGVNPDAVTSDALQFEEAVARGALREAAALYRGPFLNAFHVSQAPGFEEWLGEERARLHRMCADTLVTVAGAAELAGRWDEVVAWRRRLEDTEPLDGRNVAGLILALGRVGDRTGALRVAEQHAARIREELGAEPDGEVTSAAAAVLAMRNGGERLGTVPAESVAMAPRPPAVSARFRRGAVVAVVAGLTVTAIALTNAARRPVSSRGLVMNRVLVAAFESRLQDSTLAGLGELAADRVADGLLRSGIVEVVDPVTSLLAVRDVRAMDSLAPSDSARLGAIADAGAAAIVVTGTVERVGDSIVFHSRISDVAGERLIGAVRVASPVHQAATAGVEEVRDRVGGVISARLDRDFATLGSTSPPPRLEAYRSFVGGLEPFRRNEYAVALELFLQSARADSSFMLPVVWASYAAHNGGNRAVRDSLARVATRLVRERAGSLSELERYALLRASSMADSSRAISDYAIRSAAALAPGSSFSFELGNIYSAALRTREAIAAYEQVDGSRGWARGWPGYALRLAEAYHVAGRYERELELASDAQWTDRSGSPRNRTVPALAALGRIGEARAQLAGWFEGHAPADPNGGRLFWAVSELWEHGYEADARELFHRAMARSTEHPGTITTLTLAVCAYEAREWAAADSLFLEAMPGLKGNQWLNAMLRWSVTAHARNKLAAADSLTRAWLAYDDGRPGTRGTKLFGRAMMAGARGQADSVVKYLQQALASEIMLNGPLQVTHGPAWDPIKNAKVYRDFIKLR